MGILSNIKNYVFPTPQNPLSDQPGEWKGVKDTDKNLRNYITKVQLQRLRHDVQLWREAVVEAEQAWYPHRVRIQRMYLDTILNGHVSACMQRRKNLTLLKDYKLCNEDGVEDENYTKLLKKSWFHLYCNYVLDAQFYGYSLISLGDLVNDDFPDITTIRRFNISPDRLNVTSYVYSLSGAQFMDEPWRKWHVWQPTPTDIGISLVGYGLLYKVAMYEIICRNLLGFNTDAAELYGMPVRVGKTTKTDEDERNNLFTAMLQMGSSGAILMDEMDTLDLVESKGNGQGFKIYPDLEARCEKKISKIILGHADAIDSTPGKLGADQGEHSGVALALNDCQTVDGRMLENNINGELLPRLREMGMNIPDTLHFEIKNDREREEARRSEDENNAVTATIAYTMKQAGLQMDAAYFNERTGIPTTVSPDPAPTSGFPAKIQNRLNKIYSSAKKN
jgi:post-segregation antitoxin (ccd killing protein)